MSFILDALKKSESDRQRTRTPGISDVPESTVSRSSSRWIWIVGALLFINISILAIMLTRPDAEPPSASVADRASTQGGGAMDSAGTSDAADDPARTQTKPFSDIVAQAKRDQPVATPVAKPPPVTAAAKPETKAPRSVITESPPTFNDLRVGGSLQLPDLHLDIHVFSEKASDRFVFVNMNKYKEKATLTEGPVIEEITPDGVILGYSGQTFLLPRE